MESLGAIVRTRKERVKRMEYHLKNYRQYRIAIENLDRKTQILKQAHLESAYMPKITASYDLREGTVGTFLVRSSTEDAAIRRIEHDALPADMVRERTRFSIITDCIDAALRSLSKQERHFIEQHYFSGRSIQEIAEDMKASLTYVYDIRNALFDKLLISLSAIEEF